MLKSALKIFVIFSCQCPRPRKSNQLLKKSTRGKSAFFKHQKSQQNNRKKTTIVERKTLKSFTSHIQLLH